MSAVALSFVVCAQRPVFRSDTVLVSVDVQVLDKDTGRTIGPLEAGDFVVEENGIERPVVECLAAGDTPLDVALVLQINPARPRAREPAHVRRQLTDVLDTLRPDDRLSVMTFVSGPTVLLRFSPQPLAARAALQRALNDRTFRRSWRLYDAVLAASELFPSRRNRGRRRAVLLFFDRGERGSRAKPGQLIEAVLEKGAVIYGARVAPPRDQPSVAITVGLPPAPRQMEIWPKDRNEPVESIRPAIEQTGGELVEHPDAGTVLADCLDRIRRRYLLYFYAGKPSNPEASRVVAVRLSTDAQSRHPSAIVRGQKIYRLPALHGEQLETAAPQRGTNPEP